MYFKKTLFCEDLPTNNFVRYTSTRSGIQNYLWKAYLCVQGILFFFSIIIILPAISIALVYFIYKIIRASTRAYKSGEIDPDDIEPKGKEIKILQPITFLINITPTSIISKFNAALMGYLQKKYRLFDNRLYSVYLRTFDMDRRFMATPVNAPGLFEQFIASQLSCFGPVIIFGKKNNSTRFRDEISIFKKWEEFQLGSTGKNRIELNDDEWQEKILPHLYECKYIVIVPEYTEGTSWEVELILNDEKLLHKTIFMNMACTGRNELDKSKRRKEYTYQDGAYFSEIINRLNDERGSIMPPLEHIACAFYLEGKLYLIAFRSLMEDVYWVLCMKRAIHIKEKKEIYGL